MTSSRSRKPQEMPKTTAPTTRERKLPSKSDVLTQDKQTTSGNEYESPICQDPASQARQNHDTRTKVQVEVPPRTESLDGHGFATTKDKITDNSSSKAAGENHSDYEVTKSTPKRRGKGKKQQEQQQQQQETPEQRIETLQSKVKEFEALYAKEKATTKNLKARKADQTKDLIHRRTTQTESKRELKASQDVIKSLRRETRKLLERIPGIERATDSLDDDYLRDRLKEIRMSWQGLVSESAVTSLERIPRPYIEKLFAKAMPKPLPPLETKQLYQLFIQEPGAPRMLLGILVSHLLCETLLQDPFAFLEDASAGKMAGLKMVLDHGMLSKRQ